MSIDLYCAACPETLTVSVPSVELAQRIAARSYGWSYLKNAEADLCDWCTETFVAIERSATRGHDQQVVASC